MNTLAAAPLGVLFDLDGTLLDSAPDLYAALADYCAETAQPLPPYAPVRAVVSRGSRAILRCAFDETDAQLLERVPRYLELYHAGINRHTRPFDGVDNLLDTLERHGIAWGVVTNKPGYLTDHLLSLIGWDKRACAVISGDTLPVRKPDPAPVLLACERAGLDPSRCLFVGDDRRDIQAGAAAGLFTVAAEWGYLDGGDPQAWGADTVLASPLDLLELCRVQAVA